MKLVKGESTEKRFRLFRIKKTFIVFEREPGKKLPVGMRIYGPRGNQQLNTRNANRIARQLKVIGEHYSDIKSEKKPEESLEFLADYDDPNQTINLILEKGEP